jgi:hypothetical protein
MKFEFVCHAVASLTSAFKQTASTLHANWQKANTVVTL